MFRYNNKFYHNWILCLTFFLGIAAFNASCFLLHAQEKESNVSFISFQTLTDQKTHSLLSGKKVQIRGFLYKSSKGHWVLAPTPNIKTCCIDTHAKQNERIYLSGNWEGHSPAMAVTLQGIFRKDSKEKKFHLDTATILEKRGEPFLLFSLLGLGATVLLLYLTRVLDKEWIRSRILSKFFSPVTFFKI